MQKIFKFESFESTLCMKSGSMPLSLQGAIFVEVIILSDNFQLFYIQFVTQIAYLHVSTTVS